MSQNIQQPESTLLHYMHQSEWHICTEETLLLFPSITEDVLYRHTHSMEITYPCSHFFKTKKVD
jgi:hypothetical protein